MGSFRRSELETRWKILGFFSLLILLLWGYLISSGEFGKLWTILTANLHIFIALALVNAFGLYWWKKHREFSNRELGFYAAYSLFVVTPVLMAGYMFLTDMGAREIWNGYAEKSEYTERYYTTSTDDEGNTTYTWHGPYYQVYSTAGVVDLTEGEYLQYVQLWGGSRRVTSRINLLADGPGLPEIYTITWDGRQETKTPVSVSRPYMDYRRGSSTAITRGSTAGFEELLPDYPGFASTALGDIDFQRVVYAGPVALDGNFAGAVDRRLDLALMEVGAKREVNVIVVVAATDRIKFFNALYEHWQGAAKNDVVVVVGYPDGKLSWCRVLALSASSEFATRLASRIHELGTLEGKSDELVDTIISQIDAPGGAGYQRISMDEMAHLASSIEFAWWAQALVILLGCMAMVPYMFVALHD